MMAPFPQDWELIGLFACEPALLDPGLPWAYNHLTFATENGSDRIVCEIEPGYEILKFRWWRGGVLCVDLDCNWVRSLRVDSSSPEHEGLTAEFRYGGEFVRPLHIQLRPHVLVSWGTCVQFR